MRVGTLYLPLVHLLGSNSDIRIVEYATMEQAQQAVQTLSNRNLMGRLVYVREVSCSFVARHRCSFWMTLAPRSIT